MNGHPHAEIAQEYWQEAETNADAWKNWECRSARSNDWDPLLASPRFDAELVYRRKPRVILVNGHEVPEPLRVKPEIGDWYYAVYSANPSVPWVHSEWCDDSIDNARFDAGICHATKEATIAHANAMLSFTQKGGEA